MRSFQPHSLRRRQSLATPLNAATLLLVVTFVIAGSPLAQPRAPLAMAGGGPIEAERIAASTPPRHAQRVNRCTGAGDQSEREAEAARDLRAFAAGPHDSAHSLSAKDARRAPEDQLRIEVLDLPPPARIAA